MKTVALCYVRKSLVKEGGIDPASPEIQRRQLAAWCTTAHLEPEWHEDADGHQSGRNLRRTGWLQVRARLAQPDVAALVVTSWDRAARSAQELLAVADACDRASARFVSVTDNIDTRTADGRLQLTILAGVAEHYSRRVGEWRAAAIDQLRRNRGRHYGTAPFGTQRVPKDGDLVLVPSDLTQPNGTDHAALLRVYQLFSIDRLSYDRVALTLNADGWRYRNRYGELRPWTPEDVRRAVRQHWIYSGNVIIGQVDRGPVEVIPGSHGQLLPTPLTTAAGQRVATFRARGRWPHPPRRAPLTGLLYCVCGERYRARGSDGDGPRYGGAHACPLGHPHSVAASVVEQATREYLAGLRFSDSVVLDTSQATVRSLMADPADTEAEAERIRLALARLVDLYTAGEVDREIYRAKKAQLEAAMPQATATPPTLAVPAIGEAILGASDTILRDLAPLLLERIVVNAPGIAFTLRDDIHVL